MSHYKYLDRHLPKFLLQVGINWNDARGLITAHGDKCYSYRDEFEQAGMTFEQGVAIYLLTYCRPYARESRETDNGWVDPKDWVIKNKDRFLSYLP